MVDTLHNAPIVLDNGSGTIRAGFAGEDLPKCYFPSFVGRPKHLRVLAGALEGDVFIGQRAQELRGLLKIRYPLEYGIVTDWDDMERIWQYVYTEELKTLSEEVWYLLGGAFQKTGVVYINLAVHMKRYLDYLKAPANHEDDWGSVFDFYSTMADLPRFEILTLEIFTRLSLSKPVRPSKKSAVLSLTNNTKYIDVSDTE
ncbi:MAG: actin [Lasallia pustulata]|uniref:Actin n=1 Tax=Lasallia pustulata TaxID=136370 RepID=A0A5M8PXW6_9LECA|nr:MAG: actin [Lasallia pustulata]